MPVTFNFQYSLSFDQIVDLIQQLPSEQKKKLVKLLYKEKTEDDFSVPEKHKQLIRQRISQLKKDDLLDWDVVEKKLDKKHGL
jgi:hypothetical protein